MKIMKRLLLIVLSISMIATLLVGCGGKETTPAQTGGDQTGQENETHQVYPTKNINGVISFGPTSGTDGMSRAIATVVESELGTSFIMQNQAGASGSIATNYVLNQPADGYTVLFGSDSNTMFQVLGTIDIGLDALTPISVYARDCGILCTYPDSKFSTFEEVIDYAKEHPGEITVGTTGMGGLPDIWFSILENKFDIELTKVSFDGSGDANTALMGKHIDLFVPGITTSKPLVEAGSVKPLLVFDTEDIEGYGGVPKIVDNYPDFEKYLPYGSFFVASVKAGTPDDIVTSLTDAFNKAYNSRGFKDYLATRGNIPMGISGDEAMKFMKHQQSVVAWLLYDMGQTDKEPSEYGVERVE